MTLVVGEKVVLVVFARRKEGQLEGALAPARGNDPFVNGLRSIFSALHARIFWFRF
jgi:hypothetical protein